MANFGTMQAELQLSVMAKLLGTDTATLLNQAQREEVESGWPWSTLYSNTVIYSQGPLTQGTVSVSQGSPFVTGTGTNFTALNAQFTTTDSFIHIGTSQVAVPVLSVQDDTDLTLSLPWLGQSFTNISYNIQTTVYSVVGYIEVYNVRQILDLQKTSREQINLRDPARLAAMGAPSTEWADAGFDANGNIQIELWGPPANVYPYIVEGKLGAATMVNNTDLPQIASAVIQNKALAKCAAALYASNGNRKYMDLVQLYATAYDKELNDARAADSRRQQQIYISEQNRKLGLDVVALHDYSGIAPGE